MFGSLASCSEALVVAGFTTFLPKIIETQFQQTAGYAAIVAGKNMFLNELLSEHIYTKQKTKTLK